MAGRVLVQDARGLTIPGGAALAEAIRRVSETVRRDSIREGLHPGALEVARRAQELAPRATARMARSIYAEVVESDDQHADILVGPAPRFFYARFAEFGTRPHPFRRALSRAQRRRNRATLAAEFGQAGTRVHPGTTAQPFLRPAIDELAPRVVDLFGQHIAAVLTEGAR